MFALLPLAAVAAIPRLHDQGRLALHFENTFIPVSANVRVAAAVGNGGVRLSWKRSTPPRTAGFYRVMRAKDTGVACAGRLNNSSDNCGLYVDAVGTTKETSFVDSPGAGTWTYRIGIAANWLDDPTLGDVYSVSEPVTVMVR